MKVAVPAHYIGFEDFSAPLVAKVVERAHRSPNPVMASLLPVITDRQNTSVMTHIDRIETAAGQLKNGRLEPEVWDLPSAIAGNPRFVIQAYLVMTAVNFRFWRHSDGGRYAVDSNGKTVFGFDALFANIKDALTRRIPILDANYLAQLTLQQARNDIFHRRDFEIPDLPARVSNLNNVGKVLLQNYHGEFLTLYEQSKGYAFGQNGMVTQLTQRFDSFKDACPYRSGIARFDKRAQIGTAILSTVTQADGKKMFPIRDDEYFTGCADYQIPKALRQMGVMTLSSSLEEKIKKGDLIPKGSNEEIAIRAHTLFGMELLLQQLRQMGVHTNIVNLDCGLWFFARSLRGLPFHRTITDAY